MTGGAGPRRTGAQWERDVRDYFRARGFDAERAYGAGRPDDVGDLIVGAWVPLLVECKANATAERAAWMDAARAKVEAWRSNAIPLIVQKRRGRKATIADAYVTLDLAGFCSLVEAVARRVGDLDERDVGA